MGDNLPAVINRSQLTEVRGVSILTAETEWPSIMQRLGRVSMDKTALDAQQARYQELEGHDGVRDSLNSLAEGRIVIDLSETLISHVRSNGGLTPLAIGRPCDRNIYATVYGASTVVDYWAGRPLGRAPFYTMYHHPGAKRGTTYKRSHCQVPTMPPEIAKRHPKAAGAKDGSWLLLWEADWSAWREHTPRPPFDPALLEHISGTLYNVAAVWDLTFVEMAALAPAPRF